jgi:hypothetical protein
MPRDERKRKKGLNESEVASPEMEANLKAIEEDAKRAESERLRTLAQPQPKQQQTQSQPSISEEDRKRIRESEIQATRKERNLEGINNESQRQSIESSVDRYMADLSPEELEAKRNQLAQSQAIQNLNNTVSASTGAASTTLVNATANDPNSTAEDLDNARKIGAEADNISDKEIANNLNNANAQSETLRTGISADQKPTYDPDNKQLDKDLKTSIPDAPVLALEKLGVQDYYPTVGRDIAVGTFTGSRIGSQTIYTGAGGLLPMGLYDARQRAKAQYVKDNLAAIDKFLTVPDTYQVYNDVARPYAAGILQDIAARNGYDYSKIMKDREGMVMLQRIKGGFEKFAQAGTAAEALKKQMMEAKGDIYIPDNVRKDLIKFTNAQIDPDEVKKYLTGEKNSGDLTKNLIAYAAGSKYIKDMATTWFKESGVSSVPLSVKTGEELDPKDAQKMKDELIRLKKLNSDNDAYITFAKKYFSIDPTIMENWAKEQGVPVDDEIIGNWTDLLTKMIPDASVIPTIESIVNNNADRAIQRARLDLDREKLELDKQQALTEHQRVQNNFNNSGFASNFEYTSRWANPEVFNSEISKQYKAMGLNPQVNTSGVMVGRRPIEGDKTLVGTNPNSTYIVVGKKNYTPEQILNNKALYENDPDLKAAAEAVINNQAKIQANSIDYLASYYDNDGSLKAGNWRTGFGKQPKDRITLRADIEGNISLPVKDKGPDGEPIITYTVSPYRAITVGDVNSEGMRVVLDQVTGGSGSAPGKTTSRENYSYSSSSSE